MGNENALRMEKQSIIVAGGSKGLGLEISKELAARGANLIIVARDTRALENTREELSRLRKYPDQWFETHSVDLTNATEVQSFIASLKKSPSSVFCVAGGTAEEVGYFAEIKTDHILSCFQKNYLSSAYLAHAILQRWLAEPTSPGSPSRHIVFTASTAAFVALPSLGAYTPAKTALRALADTLRQEMLLYEPEQIIRIHCSFPGTMFTGAWAEEQRNKPELCKQLEGTTDQVGKGMTAKAVAKGIIGGLDHGDYLITVDMDTKLLLNNMRGPSPPNSYLWDWILGWVASLVWPFYRRSWDRKTIAHNYKQPKRA